MNAAKKTIILAGTAYAKESTDVFGSDIAIPRSRNKSLKKRRSARIEYKMSLDEKRSFYESRKKEILSSKDKISTGVYHIYDDDGNLAIKNKEGGIEKIIGLSEYRAVSLEERDFMETQRKTAIGVATKVFNDAFIALHNEYQRKDRSDQRIMEYNKRVVEADHHLQFVRYPVRSIRMDKGIEIRKLDFTQPDETRKVPYRVASLQVSPFPLQEYYVREGKLAEPMKTVSQLQQPTESVILFQDAETNDYGFLALDWVVQIEFEGTVYHSAKQALAAELAKAFQDDENYQKIMDAQTPVEVTYSIDDTKEDPQEWATTTKKLLYGILERKFRQYPALQARLLETKQSTLAAYQPRDTLLGIGISMDDIHAKNPIYWTGQNLLGTVLMDIRKKLYEESEALVSQANVPKKKSVVRKKPLPAPSVSAPAPSVSAPAPSVSAPVSAPSPSVSAPAPVSSPAPAPAP